MGSEIEKPEQKPIIHEYLMHETLERPEDTWCADCQSPSMWWAGVVRVGRFGVTPWGYLIGCGDCKRWLWYRKDGTFYKELLDDKEIRKEGKP